MTLANISPSTTTIYSGFYNTDKNSSMSAGSSTPMFEQDTNAAKNIILVKKGSTGYMTDVDFDDNGDITLEELNKYCEENGVSDKDKIAMLTTIELSKVKEKLIEKNVRQAEFEQEDKQPKDTVAEDSEKSVYAKKGEDKYNEAMDNNKDGIVTYIEYVKYCTEQAENNSKSSSKDTYTNKKTTNDNDVISTVEYVL